MAFTSQMHENIHIEYRMPRWAWAVARVSLSSKALERGQIGGKNLQAAVTAAGTPWPVQLNADVAELAGAIAEAAVKLAIHYYPGADTLIDFDEDHIAESCKVSRSKPDLTQS